MTADLAPAWSAAHANDPHHGITPTLIARAKRLYAQRRQRDRVFGSFAENFNEPAWDMLLDLFVAHGEGKQVSVSSACLAACVPATTGLRWVGFLVEAGMIEERVDKTDRRRRFVYLTSTALTQMEVYLSALD